MLMHFKGTSFLKTCTCWSEPHLRRLDPLIKLICSNCFSVLFNTAFNVGGRGGGGFADIWASSLTQIVLLMLNDNTTATNWLSILLLLLD